MESSNPLFQNPLATEDQRFQIIVFLNNEPLQLFVRNSTTIKEMKDQLRAVQQLGDVPVSLSVMDYDMALSIESNTVGDYLLYEDLMLTATVLQPLKAYTPYTAENQSAQPISNQKAQSRDCLVSNSQAEISGGKWNFCLEAPYNQSYFR
ncbi:hypothetical protein FGO68_gene12244 [Halteria grandinella]|uniref:Ubiquitin-like domain-containing protein n=1 Tax=Halteria grandinella TaxID=5974 RepID=A0A8J8P236_HALGN|nr:hypothetical protein FGO68_gene12244 [Halteria grandinella]